MPMGWLTTSGMIQLAPVFNGHFKAHRLFKDLPFFQNAEAVSCDLYPLLCIKGAQVHIYV